MHTQQGINIYVKHVEQYNTQGGEILAGKLRLKGCIVLGIACSMLRIRLRETRTTSYVKPLEALTPS